MTGLDHREGGLANVALSGRARWSELNADGIHVNADSMKVASKCIQPESLILTSDAIAAAELPYGPYSYFGKAAVSDLKGVRYRDSGTLIGSNKLGIEIVLSFSEATGSSLAASVASMSKTPIQALGLDPAEVGGSVEVGASDDLYAWDKDFKTCQSLRELAGGKS
jgi:N-acetylglucosamine-6-phosphate deacetylase